ncbi:hypothetical protein [Sphingomonas rubra]|uniref:Uncharacterized protein n=1 Tax=Sphingomonas rubra TaxID=634430 RepID=A0A1I5SHZ8_9SPHN|nr:hypothetical protein [Sphingomonas rubra]SFP70390.1 hypothetical protein SAMN04488241_105246 [Sphingomonas rubra]
MAEPTVAELEALIRNALTMADELDELLVGALLSTALDQLAEPIGSPR